MYVGHDMATKQVKHVAGLTKTHEPLDISTSTNQN